MSSIILIVTNLILAFVGFAIGRIGHIYGGQMKSPHHWIYGVILMFAGILIFLVFFESKWSLGLISVGFGLSVSDLEDMADFKVYGVDLPGKKRFWGVD